MGTAPWLKPKPVKRISDLPMQQQLVGLVVERTGGRPITVTLPNLIFYLVDEVSDGAGTIVRRQTLLLQVPGDGRLITDSGR